MTRLTRSAATTLAELAPRLWVPGAFRAMLDPPGFSADAWLARRAGASWEELAEPAAAPHLMALLRDTYGLGESGVYGLRCLERMGGRALAVQYLRDLEATVPTRYLSGAQRRHRPHWRAA